MKSKWDVLTLTFIVTILISGCIGQEEKKVERGSLIIRDFSSDTSTITAGDIIELMLEVENVGGVIAKNAYADLYGVIFDEDILNWKILEPTGENPKHFDFIDDLLPAEKGIPGERKPHVWLLRSPSGLMADTVYTFGVRVGFDYSTDVSGILTFISADYWRSLSQDKKEELSKKGGISQLSQTPGPLSINLYAGDVARPFVVYDPTQKQYILKIIINNVGTGKPTNNKVSIVKQTASTGLSISCPEEIILSRGESATVPCELTLNSPESIKNRQDFTLSLEFEYNWYVDSSTDVTVKKSLMATIRRPTTTPGPMTTTTTPTITSTITETTTTPIIINNEGACRLRGNDLPPYVPEPFSPFDEINIYSSGKVKELVDDCVASHSSKLDRVKCLVKWSYDHLDGIVYDHSFECWCVGRKNLNPNDVISCAQKYNWPSGCEGCGVCIDFATTLYSLLVTCGSDCGIDSENLYLVTGCLGRQGKCTGCHAWLLYKHPTLGWVFLDPTNPNLASVDQYFTPIRSYPCVTFYIDNLYHYYTHSTPDGQVKDSMCPGYGIDLETCGG